MMNFIEEVGITGHLTIVKKYKDGEEEVVFDDHNIIVSGMGVGLSYLFTGSGSNSILDYQIDRFQLGVSAKPNSELEVSSTYELSGPLNNSTTGKKYGDAGNTFIEVASQIKPNTVTTGVSFALIPPNKITRINETSVRYTLVVDEELANGLVDGPDQAYLNEVGLFMKNPTGAATTNQSILVAYRNFSDIYKTNDFSLIFRWTLNF
jgi:hypothetical protein